MPVVPPLAANHQEERSVDERQPKRHRSYPGISGETISDQATDEEPAGGDDAYSHLEEKLEYEVKLENWRQDTQ